MAGLVFNPSSLIAARLSLFYVAVFLVIGVMLPFWPVWMQARGLTASEIGLLTGLGVAAKIVANPFWAELSDRQGKRKQLMCLLAFLSFVAFAAFHWAFSFWPMFFVTAIFFFCFSPLMPLIESTTVLSASRHGLNYGRIRLWGSASFILAAMVAGKLMEDAGDNIIHPVLMGCLAFVLVAAFVLPEAMTERGNHGRFALIPLLKNKPLMIMMGGAALIQGSHGAYYSFGSIHWLGLGFSDTTIGFLWAEGVVIEILFFIVGAALIKKTGVPLMLLIGGLAAAIRWPLTAVADEVWMLVMIQALHALSYGATHLAGIYFIAERIPQSQSSSVQSLYSALVMGLVLGGVMFGTGQFFEDMQGGIYWYMAAIALLGCLATLPLFKHRTD